MHWAIQVGVYSHSPHNPAVKLRACDQQNDIVPFVILLTVSHHLKCRSSVPLIRFCTDSYGVRQVVPAGYQLDGKWEKATLSTTQTNALKCRTGTSISEFS